MQTKKLEDLNLMDDFLMNRIMSDTVYGEEFARTLLGIIFHRKMGHLSIIPQKVEYGLDTHCHGIRLDVYMDEDEGGIFDLEPDQTQSAKSRHSLPRRVRFYHAKIDAAALASGSEYKSLRNVCVIFITTYDPFDKKRMVYTIKNCCTEEPQLPYEDGARTIFLYTKGVNGNPPAELAELLRYMEDTTEKNVSNENIEKLHQMVQHTKQDAKAGLAYMKLIEIRDMWQEEGKRQGELLSHIKIIKKLQNQTPGELSDLTGQSLDFTEKIIDAIREHPEWSAEQVLEKVQSQHRMPV